MKSNRFWMLVLGGILVASIVASLLFNKNPANLANIYQNGELIETIDISTVEETYSFTIENDSGLNVIEVAHGKIRIARADCPDESCVRQGWLSSGMRPIVCLPHKLVIQLENSIAPKVDAIVG